MNTLNRFLGIFLSPQQTIKAVSGKPVWIDALIILFIFTALFSYFSMPYQQQDTYQMMQDNVKLRERMGEDRFEDYLEGMKTPSTTGILIRSFLLGPLFLFIGFLFQCLILLGMGRLSSTEGKYKQIFAVFLHARFIDIGLGGALRLFLVLSKKSFFQTSTSLAVFFPKLEVTSSAYIVLSQFDFFQLWAYGIIGLGLSYVFKVEPKKGLIIAYILWFIKALLYISIGFISRSFMT
jgi:hypothetical protein